MPRIPVAVAVLALTVAAVGWNMARYPAIWDMVQPSESHTTNSPQSNKLELDRAEAPVGHRDAAGPQEPGIGSEITAAQSLPEASADEQRSILVIEEPQAGAFGDLTARNEPQSDNATAHSPAAEHTPAAEPTLSAPTGAASARPATDKSVPAFASAPDRAALDGGPSARVLGVAAVAVSRGAATPEILPSESPDGPRSDMSTDPPPNGLLRLPPVAAGRAQLPELQCTTPGTPIPVYPSSGID